MRRSEGNCVSTFGFSVFPYFVLLKLELYTHAYTRIGLIAAIIHGTNASGVPPIVSVGRTRYLFSSV